MSGLAGVVRFDGGPVDPAPFSRMMDALAHRGPDGVRRWQGGGAALGHCLLRTGPERVDEAQPLLDEGGRFAIVFDGWLSNRDDLADQTDGDACDAAIVMRGFSRWGAGCVDRLDGDFAFAIWDARERTLFCARDRLGHKPLFWRRQGATFLFASEPGAIVRGSGEPAIDEGVLAEFLAADWRTRDATLWRGVNRLVAAHTLVAAADGEAARRYWRAYPTEAPNCSDEAYVERYRAALFATVRSASRSTTTLACEVSGGLDSSAVFAAAWTLQEQGELGAPGVEGYFVAFDDGSAADEAAYARSVGAHLGVQIHEFAPTFPTLDAMRARAAQRSYFPSFPNMALGAGLRHGARAAGARVLLSGEGGDEFLSGGASLYAEALASLRVADVAREIAADAAREGWLATAGRFARHGLLPLLPRPARTSLRSAWRAARGATRAPLWLSAPMRRAFDERPRLHVAADTLQPRLAGRAPMLDALADPFGDLAAEMADMEAARSGLELRYPMRSRAFVDEALATPARMRLRAGRSKFLHVRAMEGLLPANVLARRDKADFSIAFQSAFAKMSDALNEDILTRRRDWIDPAGFARLAQRAAAGDVEAFYPLWSIYGCHLALPSS